MNLILKKLEKKKIVDIRDAVFFSVLKIMKNNKKVIILTNDMSAFGLEVIKKQFPKRVINVGVSEQNMISVASGFAQSGFSVFVYGIISHVVFRALEQIKIDICIQNLPVVILGVGAGLSYGADGPTHHGVDDIAVMRSIPNMNIYNPSDPYLAKKLVFDAYYSKKASYLRIDKEKLPELYNSKQIIKSRNYFLHGKKNNGLLICSGLTTWLGLKVRESFYKNDFQLSILDLYKINNKTDKNLLLILNSAKFICILEESIDPSPIASYISTMCLSNGIYKKLKIYNLKSEFFLGSATREHVWRLKAFNSDFIKKEIIKTFHEI